VNILHDQRCAISAMHLGHLELSDPTAKEFACVSQSSQKWGPKASKLGGSGSDSDGAWKEPGSGADP
jgi:hypothetical protein